MKQSFSKKCESCNFDYRNLSVSKFIRILILVELISEISALSLRQSHLRFSDLRYQQNSPPENQDSIVTQTISIVCMNDIHGHALPMKLKHPITDEIYDFGGLQYLTSMIQTIKKENEGKVLIFSAGDQIQGGIQSSPLISNGSILAQFFNQIQISAHTVGNHEFDFGPQILDKYINNVDGSLILSNLIDTSQNPPTLPLPKQEEYKVFNIQVNNQGRSAKIKIGVISILTNQTYTTTAGFQGRNDSDPNLKGKFPQSYYISDNYSKYVANLSKILRQEQKVDAVILMGHLGNQCDRNDTYSIATYTEESQFFEKQREEGQKIDQLNKLIDQLEDISVKNNQSKSFIDAVIQGHRHTTSHYFYKGIPIVGSMNDGLYFNVLYLNFSVDYSKSENASQFVKQQTKIQGPISVCQKVFAFSNNCSYFSKNTYQKNRNLNFTLIDKVFHNVPVTASENYLNIIDSYKQTIQPYDNSIIQLNVQEILTKNYNPNTDIGKIVLRTITNQLRQESQKFDFMVYNPGGFRGNWIPGNITRRTVYDMFPFDTELYKVNITGKQLKIAMNFTQKGKKGFYPTDGLVLFAQKKIQHKKKIQLQTIHDILVRQDDQYEWIDDKKIYTMVTIKFLLDGGDDFSLLPKKIFQNSQKLIDTNGSSLKIRQVLERGLKSLSNQTKQIDQHRINSIQDQFQWMSNQELANNKEQIRNKVNDHLRKTFKNGPNEYQHNYQKNHLNIRLHSLGLKNSLNHRFSSHNHR